ncbi:MAG: hypothetical protein HQK51_16855 [Oligoflexia bacterium]|nr:hypothetical protein [Oligoflexia bacterium]
MYILRKINSFLFLIFFFTPVIQHHTNANIIEISTGIKRQKHDLRSISDRTNSRIKSENVNLKYKMNESESFNYTGALSLERPNYDEQIIINERGQKIPLSTVASNKPAPFLSNIIEYSDKDLLISSTIFFHLVNSPYRQIGASIIYEYFLFLRSTIIGGEISYYQQKQPKSFFINNDFRIEQRPLTIHANQAKLFCEQTLTRNHKTKIEVQSSERKKERPRNYGVEISLASALSNRVYSILKTNYITEGKSQKLYDERGYYLLYGADLQITYEPFYDLFFSLSYGLNIEEEKDPRTNFHQRVGSDTYGFGTKYSFSKTSFYILSSYSNSNTGSNDFNLSGGMGWEI